MIRMIKKNLKYIIFQTKFKLILCISLLLNSTYIITFNYINSDTGFANGIDYSLLISPSGVIDKTTLNIVFFIVFIILLVYYVSDLSKKNMGVSFYEYIRISKSKVIASRIITTVIVSLLMSLIVYGINMLGMTTYAVIINNNIVAGNNNYYSMFEFLYADNFLSITLLYNSWIYPLFHLSLFSLFICGIGVLTDALSVIFNRTFSVVMSIFGFIIGAVIVLELYGLYTWSFILIFFQATSQVNENLYFNYVTKGLIWSIVPILISVLIYYLVYKVELLSEKN